jgi:hypothetical protein
MQGNPAHSPRIEGVEMQKAYYSWITKVRCLALAFLILLAVVVVPATRRPDVQQQSSKTLKTSSLDSHDGLTIAADPWLSAERYKPTFPKKSPYGAGVLAIKVTFRNDSDDSIKVTLERIRLSLTFEDSNRQDLPALSSEQLADAVLHPKVKGPSKPRLPIPIPTSPGGRDKHWQEYKKLAEDAGLHASIVAPHSSIEGLLYFDLQNQFDLLQNARLYVPDLLSLEKNRSLLYFEIDLSHPSSR